MDKQQNRKAKTHAGIEAGVMFMAFLLTGGVFSAFEVDGQSALVWMPVVVVTGVLIGAFTFATHPLRHPAPGEVKFAFPVPVRTVRLIWFFTALIGLVVFLPLLFDVDELWSRLVIVALFLLNLASIPMLWILRRQEMIELCFRW